jgi:DNA-3-methyladenine glycosylase II
LPKRFLLTKRRIRTTLDTLAAAHQPIAGALRQVGYPDERRSEAGFSALARIVIGQQVSVAAARSIAGRVEEALGGTIEAGALEAVDDERLRGAGLSRQKVRYLRSLAHAVNTGELQIDELPELDDATVVSQITAVTGFGVWSAHMYLMFSLGRPDVWPSGDLAVRNGFARMLGWSHRPSEKEVQQAGAMYAPHRSALALLCWRYYSEAPL